MEKQELVQRLQKEIDTLKIDYYNNETFLWSKGYVKGAEMLFNKIIDLWR